MASASVREETKVLLPDSPNVPVSHVPQSCDLDGFHEHCKSQLAYWQRVLRLQDWNIDLRIAPIDELKDCIGESTWYLSRKDAIIKLLRPDHIPVVIRDFPAGDAADYDTTIVHELLHLHFAPFGDGAKNSVELEQAINAISRALVNVYRGADEEQTPVPSKSSHGHYL